MIDVIGHTDGCVLAVRAQPGARKSGIVGEQNGTLKVAVTAPADRGRANSALAELLAESLGLRKSQVELVSGRTSRDKRFLLRGVTPEQMRGRLQKVLAPFDLLD